MIETVFWDSDNTLVDTAEHHWRKHFETLKKHGIALDDQWRNRIYTNNGAQNWEWLRGDLGLNVPLEAYLNEIDQWYFDHIEEIAVRDGIHEALAIFEKEDLPMAVVSNGRRRSVMAALEAKDLVKHFRFVLCIEDYKGRKPEPGPYLAAKTKMQQALGQEFLPANCLVIEDDPKGVESGLAAGMKVLHRGIDDRDTRAFLEQCQLYVS